MILVVDIGNSRIKWARVSEGKLVDVDNALSSQFPEKSLKLMAEQLPSEITQVTVANVAGNEMASALTSVCSDHWGIRPEFIVPKKKWQNITCAYSDPSRLGIDRWVAMIAAYSFKKRACAVIDAGTTVTLDAVDFRGQHLGGLIMAGPGIIHSALQKETSDIGEIRFIPSVASGIEVLGKDTKTAVSNGTMFGISSALNRALIAIMDEIKEKPVVYITGGHAEVLSSWLETRTEYRQNLVLEGLALIATKN